MGPATAVVLKNMKRRTPVDKATLRTIAVATDGQRCPRTVAALLRGEIVRDSSARDIVRALVLLGLAELVPDRYRALISGPMGEPRLKA